MVATEIYKSSTKIGELCILNCRWLPYLMARQFVASTYMLILLTLKPKWSERASPFAWRSALSPYSRNSAFKMTPKKILIGPTYQGLVDSEDHARLLIRTYINSIFFCPQQPEKQDLARLIRSGYVLLYEENERGVDFWSDGDDWTFIGFDESIRICRNSSTPRALMRKEFSMVEGGTHYSLAAYYTGEAAARSHMVRSHRTICYCFLTGLMQKDSSGLKYEHKLEPTMSRGPWEIIRLSAKDADPPAQNERSRRVHRL